MKYRTKPVVIEAFQVYIGLPVSETPKRATTLNRLVRNCAN